MTAENLIGGIAWLQGAVILAALIFAGFDGLFAVTKQRRNILTRRRMALAALAGVALLPFGLPALLASGYGSTLNATEVLVAQYLKGNLSMSASEVTSLLDMQARWISQLSTAATPASQAALALFGGAFILRAAYLVLNVARIRRAIRAGQLLRRSRRVSVLLSPEITVPFSTRGLWRYYVVMPVEIVADSDTMSMSLGHELQHIRQGDVDAEVLLSLASPLLVLNPGFWFLSAHLRKLGELACDRVTLKRRGFDPHTYALRLLAVARHNRDMAAQPAAFGVPLLGRALPVLGRRRSMLKDRIVEIAREQSQPSRDTWAVSLGLSALMVAAVLGSAASLAQPKDWSHERLMLSSVANLERLNQLNTLAQRSW